MSAMANVCMIAHTGNKLLKALKKICAKVLMQMAYKTSTYTAQEDAMQQVYVLQLAQEPQQYTVTGVYTSYALAEAVLQNINEEYAVNCIVYVLGENARIQTITVNT